MIYPANFEQKVGFDRLREQVAALCTIRGGRERLCAEQFSTSQADVERRLALADEMRRLLEMEHDFPDDEFVDVDYILSKLKIEGSFLEVEEVVLLRRALASAGAIAGFILGRGEELYPELRLRSRGIEAFPEIVRAIDGIVDQYGKIRDDASPELQQIRRMILEREGQAAKRLQQRITELGVRKAFGGTKSVLVRQILNENLMLTLLGGVVGLLFSYLAVYAMRMWLFTNNQNVGTSGELSLNMEALFSPWVFLLAFVFCVVINLLSAALHAWIAARHTIVDSLNDK